MPRTLPVLILFLSLTTPVLAESPSVSATVGHPATSGLLQSNRCAQLSPSARPTGFTTYTAPQCCRICHKGKACGNTCISRDKICHVGPGCACDG
jgi:hypothetical protein